MISISVELTHFTDRLTDRQTDRRTLDSSDVNKAWRHKAKAKAKA